VVETRHLWDETNAVAKTEAEDDDDLEPLLPEEDVQETQPPEEPPC
jgi:hypothetical protein